MISNIKILVLLFNTLISAEWVLTFEDDFSGNKLNESSWTISNYSSIISQYDGHDALFVTEAITVKDGSLQITTTYNPQVFNGVHYNMTSGWIDSQKKRNQTAGRFEASIKMPNPNATGSWPAFWLLPEETPWPVSGEVDIVEWYALPGNYQHSRTDNPVVAQSTYHYGYSAGDDIYSYNNDSASFPSRDWSPNWPIIDFSADFHTFGVEINSTFLRFYVDNYTSFTKFYPTLCVTDPVFLENGGWGHSGYMPFKPLYSILNVAVTPNANTSWWLQNHQTTTLVDWVRWYEYQ